MDLISLAILQSQRTRAWHIYVISLPKGLASHQPSDIYPSLQLVPGDLVVDPGVHDVAGPLGHALDHLDDVVSETLISKLHFLNSSSIILAPT